MVRISNILIGMIFVTLIVTGLVLFFAGGVNEYGNTDYDNSSFVKLQGSFDEIADMANETKDKMDSIKADANILDRIGLMFTSGYTAAKTVGKSYDTLNTMVDVSVNELPLGAYGDTLKTMIGIMILVIIFIAILLHLLIKSDRL